jgi:hypothetical protein
MIMGVSSELQVTDPKIHIRRKGRMNKDCDVNYSFGYFLLYPSTTYLRTFGFNQAGNHLCTERGKVCMFQKTGPKKHNLFFFMDELKMTTTKSEYGLNDRNQGEPLGFK